MWIFYSRMTSPFHSTVSNEVLLALSFNDSLHKVVDRWFQTITDHMNPDPHAYPASRCSLINYGPCLAIPLTLVHCFAPIQMGAWQSGLLPKPQCFFDLPEGLERDLGVLLIIWLLVNHQQPHFALWCCLQSSVQLPLGRGLAQQKSL